MSEVQAQWRGQTWPQFFLREISGSGSRDILERDLLPVVGAKATPPPSLSLSLWGSDLATVVAMYCQGIAARDMLVA